MTELVAGFSEDDVETEFLVRALPDVETSMRRLKHWESKWAEVQALADAQRKLIDNWQTREWEKIAEKINWHTQQIEIYHRAAIANDPKAKTLNLPSGKSIIRESNSYEWDDEALLAWAQENEMPDTWYRTKTMLEKSTIKADCVVVDDSETTGHLISLNGYRVDGVTVTRTVKHSVKFTEEDEEIPF